MPRYLPIYTQTNAQLSEIAADFQASYKVPGLAIALIRPDSVFLGLAGTRAVNIPDQIKATDKFHLGSNSKAITAFIAAFRLHLPATPNSSPLFARFLSRQL